MKHAFTFCMALLLPALTGCMTLVDESTAARQTADAEALRADVQTLQERFKKIELAQQTLDRDMETLRRSTKDDGGSRARLDELERRFQALNAARDQDRKAIIDELSKRLAALASSQSTASSGRSGSGAETGYEHVVQQGETLSAIAKAYKVSSKAIAKANNLKSETIRVGQKLFIPQP